MNGLARHLNGLPAAACRRELLRCCASRRWANRMLAHRPFPSDAAVLDAARRVWWDLDADDWLEAFAAHPRIGDRTATGPSRREQAGMDDAPAALREAVERGNAAYRERFGHVFLVRATGRSAEDMLRELERRLANDPDTERREAAAQQAEITEMRLRRLPDS